MLQLLSSFSPRLYMLALLPLLAAACSSTAEVREQPEPEEEPAAERPMSSVLSSSDYNELRITPAARTMTQRNEIPAVFIEEEDERRQMETNSGFRIQLMTTANISVADSMSLAYYDWLEEQEDEKITFSPAPDAYITFRQPYYRVRIGDFRQRENANSYLRLLRDRFPGAWVVIDSIDPEMVPEP